MVTFWPLFITKALRHENAPGAVLSFQNRSQGNIMHMPELHIFPISVFSASTPSAFTASLLAS